VNLDERIEPSAQYCREIEAYLCRKNDGHLIRIVGPAFEQVSGWMARGVPLRVAYAGIDRYFDRYYSKGPRRRPVRIEFCEADILDLFDDWRRAVGVGAVASDSAADSDAASTRRHGGLPAHLDRIVARLTALRAGPERALGSFIDEVVRELDGARTGAKAIRGENRERLLARLRALDEQLLIAARNEFDERAIRELAGEAEAELQPFRERMPLAAYEQSRRACIDRLIRERLQLPTLTFEP
jgi:hypothetical protein